MTDSSSPDSPLLQSCPDCGAVLDISEEEPFASVICPVCGAAMQARTEFNNFTLQNQIGVGGMGAVYKALDVNLNRLVALKVVLKEYSSDPAYHDKFEHEARMAALVNHPNVVKVFSFGSDHGLFYIAMELVEHGTMEDRITREGRLPEALVLGLGIQIAQGLQAAYAKGLIHRDVKPGNILFADDHTAKIVDFGLALPMAHAAGSVKEGGEVWGTPYYIAPEKLSYQPEDFRSDIYSLGASLFHALAGCPSFEGETNSFTMLRQLKSKPVSLQDVAPFISSATAYVINRTLNNDPGKRFQSYEELIEHLNYARAKLLEGPSKPGDAAAKKESMPKTPASSPLTSLTMQLLMIAILVIAGLLYVLRGKFADKTLESAPPEQDGKYVSSHATADEKYQDARRHLLRGDYAGAQKMFHDLGAGQNLPHPLDRWVLLHEGLGALLAGRLPDAQIAFGQLEQEGVYSAAPEDRTLANFFVNTGHLVAPGKPVSPAFAEQYNPANCEAFTLFILAADDREMSQFDDSEQFFQAFLKTSPKPPYEWVADYRPLAEKHVADLEDYKKITAELKAADTLEKRSKALEDLHAFTSGNHVYGRLVELLQPVENDLQTKVTAEKQDMEQRKASQLAAQHDTESKALAAARAKFLQSIPGYQFQDGLDAIQNAQIADPTLVGERENLLKKAQWLMGFKETLINDINTLGYPQPVSRLRTGVPIEGGTHKATQTQLEIQTQYGTLLVLWNELSAAQILDMAGYFTAKATAPDAVADRNWLAGVFVYETGMAKQGLPLLKKASQAKASYTDLIPLFTLPSTATRN